MSTALAVKDEKKAMIRIKVLDVLKEKNLSVYWLAEEIGVRRQTVYDIVNNKNEKLNLNYLFMIMDVLGIDDMNEVLEKVDM